MASLREKQNNKASDTKLNSTHFIKRLKTRLLYCKQKHIGSLKMSSNRLVQKLARNLQKAYQDSVFLLSYYTWMGLKSSVTCTDLLTSVLLDGEQAETSYMEMWRYF